MYSLHYDEFEGHCRFEEQTQESPFDQPSLVHLDYKI